MSTLIEVMLCKFHGDNSSSDIFLRMSLVLLIGKFLWQWDHKPERQSDIVVKCHMPLQCLNRRRSPTQVCRQSDTHFTVCVCVCVCVFGLLARLSGAKARQHACSSHGCIRAQGLCFTAAAEREQRRREREGERGREGELPSGSS